MNERNPIFIEYYSHEECDYYKVNLPWSQYSHDVMVLCPISKGIDFAKILVIGIINDHLAKALQVEI
jgi:hypothetical protein